MKSLILLLLTLCIFAGCAQRYQVTLRNHQQITTSSRPKFDKATDTYRFKDASGKPVIVPAFRIREIKPVSSGEKSSIDPSRLSR